MSLHKKSVADVAVSGKKVLLRCDFNVPLQNGVIADETRIMAALPTIRHLLSQGAAVILCSHLGRPKGQVDPKYSLRPVAARLSELLNQPVELAQDVTGQSARALAASLQPGQVMLLAVHAAVPVLLCHFQGDDGAAIVFFAMFLCMSLAGGVQIRYFVLLGALVAVSVPILWNFVLSEYQIKRFTSVYNLDDPAVQLDEGYQQYQGRLSIGSGQLTGKGLFSGPRVESNYVTFQHSDYIFSVAGEELGFLGCTAIILLLLFYLLRVLYIASKARDDLGRCMCFGFFGLIALQSVSNIGMCLALLPVMGVTLPFFSAGGSSAICLYLGFGLVQSVYMRRSGVEGPRLHSARNLKINFRKLKV